MKPRPEHILDFGDAPDPLSSFDDRLKRDEVKKRLFGEAPEPIRVGKFVLEQRLGAGAMGVVYVAHDEQLNRTVALKLVRSSAELGDGHARLLREAQVMARLSHPNVATVHEVGLWEGRVFVAMELVKGQTLRQWLASGRRGVREVLDIFVQAGSGLSAAHEQGLVHRDFKPENVMVGDDGRVRVVDFGLARAGSVGEGEDAPRPLAPIAWSTNTVAGTPAYMAPEQHKGGTLDARADQFCYCVTLYEALYGERPFAGETASELWENLERGEVRSPPRGRRVPSWLRRAVLRGLSPRPEDRWPSIRALVTELRKDRSAPPRRALLAGGMLLLGLVAAGSLWLRRATLHNARGSAGSSATPAEPPNPEAIAAYRRGLQEVRERGPNPDEFEIALKLDPSLVEAHLQLAAMAYVHVTPAIREHFRAAERSRASFSPRDQALLDAIEPLVHRNPADYREGAARLRAALLRFPSDAQLWFQLASWEINLGELADAIGHFERALVEDPGLRAAILARGYCLAFLGRFDEAKSVLATCADGPSASVDCGMILSHVLAREGSCDEIERLARQMIARGKDIDIAYWLLASSLAEQGKSTATLREVEKQALQHAPASRRKRLTLDFGLNIALWSGDFAAAEQTARDLLKAADASEQREDHGTAALHLVRILSETGREDEAGSVAMDYLDRQDAWEPTLSVELDAVVADHTPLLLAAAQRAGRIRREDFVSRREAWADGWAHKVSPFFRGYIWLEGHGAVVETREDARDALSALPRYAPLPPFEVKRLSRAGVGVAHLLDGRAGSALGPLEEGTKICTGLWFAYEHTRVHAWLGRARQAAGDTKGACEAYRAVLGRWGQARPRSVTAERVRGWMRALPCQPEHPSQ